MQGIRKLVLFLLLSFCLPIFASVSARAAEETSFYAKKDTWAQTMQATRQNYMQWLQKDPNRGGLELSQWYSTGPVLAKGFDDPLFPEKEVDLQARIGGKNAWTAQKGIEDGRVHNLPGRDRAATYLYRTIKSENPLSVRAGFGSDDGLVVWLNGKKIHSNNVPRGPGVDQDRVTLDLKQGENTLLLKIYNISGGHGFYFSAQRDPLAMAQLQIGRDFPEEMNWLKADASSAQISAWFRGDKALELETGIIGAIRKDVGVKGNEILAKNADLKADKADSTDPRWLALYADGARLREKLQGVREQTKNINLKALRMAVEDLTKTYPKEYKNGPAYLAQLDRFEQEMPKWEAALANGDDSAMDEMSKLIDMRSQALLENPLIDFDSLLLVRRGENQLGLPQNWQGNCSLPKTNYENQIAIMSPVSPEGKLTTLYRPDGERFVGDVDLHFDADKMLFSMPGSQNRWQIWEIGADGSGLRQVTPGEENDVDNYDPVYLPDGRIIFGSTLCMAGVPCVGGADTVANLCVMNADGKNIRQLCFDQDHNWCPTVTNSGRILYTRWEYSDTSHYFSRLLFLMNPDGTAQGEYYGSNSYWPNSMFYARPIPNHPTQVAAIVSGHHGVARMGELIIFDPAKGRFEADGVVQRIPGYGKKVEPVIVDALVDNSWPKFLHPYPLSDKYFLVSSKPTPRSNWGIYLVDIYDNMLLLKESPGEVLFEPVPLRKTPKPPVLPDRIDLERKDAVVYMSNIYMGQGLKNVPKGTVKNLRVYEFHFGYPQMGGHKNVGVEGGWDVHRILGTVPVNEDGSAIFRVPANTPLAVQPLDAEGKAIQIMRSWFTAMPGETLSCVGCHERQNTSPPSRLTAAAYKTPSEITPWHGPTRGYSFKRDLQPTLDKYCVGCHDGGKREDGQTIPDLARKDRNGWGNFTPSYLALHPFVRRPGPESNYRVEVPMEYHADTSELVQMLQKGHHNVQLDEEAWDRLITWIDLNVPDHGTWGEHRKVASNFQQRRIELRTRYAGVTEDPEEVPAMEEKKVVFVHPKPMERPSGPAPSVSGWPIDADQARRLQKEAGKQTRRTVDLGDGVKMDFVLVPAGEFVMGSAAGFPDESPLAPVKIDKPFWMSVQEVSNKQFNRYDPEHDNGFINQQHKDHTTPGYPTQGPNQPTIRVSWNEATAFASWLSEKTGASCDLPTEAQWEWACRAGADTEFYYGGVDADFGSHANLADLATKRLAVDGVNPQPIRNPDNNLAWVPRNNKYDDTQCLMADVGLYEPNPWGLQDMHGNVWEWTRSTYAPYPYTDNDGRNAADPEAKKVVRGGSWFDRPQRARAAARLEYPAWQKAYNVGLRVVMEASDSSVKIADADSE